MLERIITALVLVAVVLTCMFATSSHYPMFGLMIVAAGVGVLFATTPWAFQVVKWFGVIYLLYLAYVQVAAMYYLKVLESHNFQKMFC